MVAVQAYAKLIPLSTLFLAGLLQEKNSSFKLYFSLLPNYIHTFIQQPLWIILKTWTFGHPNIIGW